MSISERTRRACPICCSRASGESAFPYATRFNGVDFNYLRCSNCGGVFVDPAPDVDTFGKMYAKDGYHDAHYLECDLALYKSSARLIRCFLPTGAHVLDYGCGLGLFLQALEGEGMTATGVEFDKAAAVHAETNTKMRVFTVADFLVNPAEPIYDALHLGDVLGHLPDPAATLQDLLAYVKPGGVLFVEGPLENNPSPVYWAAQLFGTAKRILRPRSLGTTAPTLLLRVNARQQLAFFAALRPPLTTLHWDVYETGWPYADGGPLKRAIARGALLLGGKTFLRMTFGNRFRAIFRLPETL